MSLLAGQHQPPDPGADTAGLSAFKAVGSQLAVSAGGIKPASSPLTRSPVTSRRPQVRGDSSEQESGSEDGETLHQPPPAGVDTFSWPTHHDEENRQLLGTEEESSDRGTSEDEGEGEASIWEITREQLSYYVAQFRGMQPSPHGVIPGTQAKEFFEKSRLPIQELRQIWQLSDVTKDGCLSLEEFLTAMHLVVLRRNEIPLPDELPVCLLPCNLRHSVIDRHNKDLYTGPGAREPLLETSTSSAAPPVAGAGAGQGGSPGAESQVSQVSSPGRPLPVKFDFNAAVAVAGDPSIACPVPLRVSPDSPAFHHESSGTESRESSPVSRPPVPREVVYEQLWNVPDSGTRGGRHSSSSSSETEADTEVTDGPAPAQGPVSLPAPAPPRALSYTSHSQPATRPASPVSHSMPPSPQSNARTPPPKRWKRSFDLARNDEGEAEPQHTSTPGHAAAHPDNGPEFGESVAKRFCETKRYSLETEREKRFHEADSLSQPATQQQHHVKRFVAPASSYPHSMPASPTMFDARNISSLGILRHFARVGSQESGEAASPREAHENTRQARPSAEQSAEPQAGALDYRFQPADTQHAEMNGGSGRREENEVARRERLTVFRPESAPTVLAMPGSGPLLPLDMSPDASLSGPPSAHDLSTDGIDHDERLSHFRNIVVGQLQPVTSAGDLSDCVSKALNTSGGGGRYSCDECGKLFKHPGSLQHHRHIHRGTHKCPSCGKAFSRRWDMERHLNKSKYGCPANRFSGGGAGAVSMAEMSEGDLSNHSGHEIREAGPVSLVSGLAVPGLSTSLPHDTTAMVTLVPSHQPQH